MNKEAHSGQITLHNKYLSTQILLCVINMTNSFWRRIPFWQKKTFFVVLINNDIKTGSKFVLGAPSMLQELKDVKL
jgi:hypothetical protein